MKKSLYEYAIAKSKASRRTFLKGAAGAGAVAAMSGGLSSVASNAFGASDLRSAILKIPGVGVGSPGDADWQKVGEMCLGGTKERVKEGEFNGVEISFLGLDSLNLHNMLHRGFLKPWEKYTGAKIKWIDLAQADYNARLQQSIATGTVDFDILQAGAPFEGDLGGKKLLSAMPDWVADQIDLSDYPLVVSSSHLVAKGILTSPDQLHISYVHTPVRYAWDQMNIYLKRSFLRKIGLGPLIRWQLHTLRQWDQLSSSRVDYLLANSKFTAKRIWKYWRRHSEVIHPPVNVNRFEWNNPRDDFYLSVCRLVPNKRVDLVVRAFNQLQLPLIGQVLHDEVGTAPLSM